MASLIAEPLEAPKQGKTPPPGSVVSVRGSVVDVCFEESLPPLQAMLFAGKENSIVLEVIFTSGLTIGIGVIGPALGEGRAVASALTSLAQQPDASSTITRTLFVGLAMIESTAIYAFVVSMILIFANPFWNQVIAKAAGH